MSRTKTDPFFEVTGGAAPPTGAANVIMQVAARHYAKPETSPALSV